MRAVANTLIGHALILVVVGVYVAILFGAHSYGLSWLITNSGWRWFASAFAPIVLFVLIPLWMVAMHGLGESFRRGVLSN